MRQYNKIVLWCALAFVAAGLPVIHPAAAAGERPRPLRVSLFPVPDRQHFHKEVETRWNRLGTGVGLDFAKYDNWDCYSKTPPDDLDVFELDAIHLDYFVRGNWVSPLNDSGVENPGDIMDFAWRGCLVDGRLYGVPHLACTSVLFYRAGDDEVANARSLEQLARVIGETPDDLEKPDRNRGMLVNLRSGTGCACLYLNAQMDASGVYSPSPTLTPADSLQETGLSSLVCLRKMAGKNLGLHRSRTYRTVQSGSPKGSGVCWLATRSICTSCPRNTMQRFA